MDSMESSEVLTCRRFSTSVCMTCRRLICRLSLQEAYLPIIESAEFKAEYHALLKDYVGRPSPLYYAQRMSEQYGCRLYLKREDLNHTGAHKINNTIGQILLAQKMGKTRIIAEH